MAGGYICEMEAYEHQVIVITLKGRIGKGTADKWNNELFKLKKLFGDQMIAVTMRGEKTPERFQVTKPSQRRPGRKRPAARRRR